MLRVCQAGSLRRDKTPRRGRTPKIVLSIDDSASSILLRKDCLFDIIELRIDLFSSFAIDHILSVVELFRFYPIIATIRSKKEGGNFTGEEQERLFIFKKIIPYIDAVDIELSSTKILQDVVHAARKEKKKVIISHHNFKKTPSIRSLNNILKKGFASKADIVKIAVFAKNNNDLQQLTRFTLMNKDKKIVILAMGEIGAISRLFFPAIGSALTYAHFGKPTAPGQIDCATMARLIKMFYR